MLSPDAAAAASMTSHEDDECGATPTPTPTTRPKYKRAEFFDEPRTCPTCKISFIHKGQYSGHWRSCKPSAPWQGQPTRRENAALLVGTHDVPLGAGRVTKPKRTYRRTAPPARRPDRDEKGENDTDATMADVMSPRQMVQDTLQALLAHSRRCASIEDLRDLSQHVYYMHTSLSRMHTMLADIIARHEQVQNNLEHEIENMDEYHHDDAFGDDTA